MPWTLVFSATFCGAAKSLFGSFSSATGYCPTESVAASEMPPAVRTRTMCVPSRAVGSSFSFTLSCAGFAPSIETTVKPGS